MTIKRQLIESALVILALVVLCSCCYLSLLVAAWGHLKIEVGGTQTESKLVN